MGIIGAEPTEKLFSSEDDFWEEYYAKEEYAEEHRNDINYRLMMLEERINKMFSPVMTNREVGNLNTILEEIKYIKKDCGGK